jgi:hypothetical protein
MRVFMMLNRVQHDDSGDGPHSKATGRQEGAIMTKAHVAALGLFASTSAAAADLLPLAHGTYVRDGVPCREASNADTMSYWGGRNGLNIQQEDCTIRRVTRRGPIYSLGRRCRSIRFGGIRSDTISVRIHDRTAFTVIAYLPGTDAQFRYCPAPAQP